MLLSPVPAAIKDEYKQRVKQRLWRTPLCSTEKGCEGHHREAEECVVDGGGGGGVGADLRDGAQALGLSTRSDVGQKEKIGQFIY